MGTDDPVVLSAVYNQLGNAYFYVDNFQKALEYHKKDLELAERREDYAGMAKAYGNLGNTFKSLRQYPNAVRYVWWPGPSRAEQAAHGRAQVLRGAPEAS